MCKPAFTHTLETRTETITTLKNNYKFYRSTSATFQKHCNFIFVDSKLLLSLAVICNSSQNSQK